MLLLSCIKLSWEENCVLSWMSLKRLLRSQGGPLASVPFTSLPTLRKTTFAPQPSRYSFSAVDALLLPSLHVGACVAVHSTAMATTGLRARAGILGCRGFPMESVMARICREAGARVRTMAIDTTLVSPIRTNGTARRHAAHLCCSEGTKNEGASTQSWPATGDVHASWWSRPKWG